MTNKKVEELIDLGKKIMVKELQRCCSFFIGKIDSIQRPLFFSLPGCDRIVKVQGGHRVLVFYK